MTDKERLMNLILDLEYNTNGTLCDGCGCRPVSEAAQDIAVHLLSNGVTFHKWVPVVLGFLPDEKDVWEYIEKYSYAPEFIVMIQGSCDATTLQYDGELWSDEYGNTYNVTHWMPLPKPPKEE